MTRSTFKRKIYRSESLDVEGLAIEVSYKKISRIYLKIDGKNANISVCAPLSTNPKFIDVFVKEKIDWIRRNREKILQKNRYRNSHDANKIMLWGQVCEIKYFYHAKKPIIQFIEQIDALEKNHQNPNQLQNYLMIDCATPLDSVAKSKILEKFFRQELLKIANNFIEKWQKIFGVKVGFLGIKKMRTRYGSCNARHKRIWLSLNLIHYKIDFIEYVIVHEIAHFFEQNHGKKFYKIMDDFLPNWREIKNSAKDLPL